MSTPLENYLSSCNGKPDAAMTAYVASLQQVASVNPSIAADVVNEIENQRSHLKLIASENVDTIYQDIINYAIFALILSDENKD